MPERGVSRRVTVKFDEVGHDGRLAGDAVRRSESEEQTADPAVTRSESGMEIETEKLDPAALLGGRKTPESPLPESSGSRLAEAWDD